MSTKIIECIYEGGVLKPLVKIDLEEGKEVRLFQKDKREDVLDRYAGIVKLGGNLSFYLGRPILERGGSVTVKGLHFRIRPHVKKDVIWSE
jgi:predicted DNA-binding antitoxin AbrB/MazE fold protein